MKKRIISLILGSIFALSLVGCGGAQATQTAPGAAPQASESTSEGEETVKIAYLPITHALAALKEAKDLEEQTGLKVELVKYGSWTELTDALNTGNVDGASVLIELAMKAKEQGIGLKAVALGHRDGNVLIVSKDIESVEDLKGKTFAIPHRQSSHNILLNDALAKGGLTVDDINVTELAPTEMPSALAGGQIDGYCVAEPFGAKAVSLDVGKVLYTSEELWEDSICCGLVLTDKFIDERPDTAKKFVEQYKASGNSLDDESKLATAKEFLNQEDDVLEVSLKWISYNDLDITEETYDALCEKVKEYGLSENPPAYEDFVKNEF